MALTEYFIDPNVAGPGAGTVGDPYASILYAIINNTFDLVNGVLLSVRDTVDEVLTSGIHTALADTSVSIAWAPDELVPLVIRGYTTATGDGGIGGLDANASFSVFNNVALNGIHFIDMHCHNTAANPILNMNDRCSVQHCEINNSSSNGVEIDLGCFIFNCYIHDIGASGISVGSIGTLCYQNFIKDDGTHTMTSGITLGLGAIALENIVTLTGAGVGISSVAYTHVIGNSIYSSQKVSGAGINQAAGQTGQSFLNNIVEGFLTGVNLSGAGAAVNANGGNSVYNSGTDFPAVSGHIKKDWGGDESLSASVFPDPSTDDFNTSDGGLVKEGSVPGLFYQG